MIQLLATRYNKHIAFTFAFIFFVSMILPVHSMVLRFGISAKNLYSKESVLSSFTNKSTLAKNQFSPVRSLSEHSKKTLKKTSGHAVDSINIDGPSQPEMSSFKPAGTNDMVNLFTGDFSYNIPLLDVGGYPVNVFYNGGITMEQEASWVGLGWNINPGNINRNVRGVPDDFNGEEKLLQEQNMKKNITWGISLGGDLELVGIKNWNKIFSGNVGASLGYSVNNYLGPAIELGLKGTTSFSIAGKAASEKAPLGVSMGLQANLNSRSGMTLTPNISLSARTPGENAYFNFG